MIASSFRALLFLLALPGLVLAQGVTLPAVERVVLENGVVLLLHEKDDVPLIGLEASIRGGAVSDPDGLGGTANLLAGLLEKGAGARNSAEFAEAIDAVGGELSAAAETEFITVTGEFLARDADLVIELLSDMLRRPTLADDEIRKLRERSIAELQAAKDGDVRALTPIYGNAYLFGDHPYGNSLYGDEESLARITAADLRDYYAQYFGGDRLIVSVVVCFLMVVCGYDAYCWWTSRGQPKVISGSAMSASACTSQSAPNWTSPTRCSVVASRRYWSMSCAPRLV